jgi:drug/metabolite transporter (DMT)-like permease
MTVGNQVFPHCPDAYGLFRFGAATLGWDAIRSDSAGERPSDSMNGSVTTSQRAMFVFICFVWGTTWLAMKIGISTVSPGVFAGLRWSIAGALILAYRRFKGQRVMPPPRLIPRLVFVSVILITLNQVIQLYGLKYITAGLAAVISSALTPIALLVFAVAAGQERFSARQMAALSVGVLGVFLLFGPAAVAGTLDVWEVIGAAGVTIACLFYTAGSVMTRPIMRTLEPVQLAGLTDVIGGMIMLVAALCVEPGAWQSMAFHWGWPAFLAWLYLLVPGALMSTTMYFLLVRDWGASRPGTYAFISPVIAVAIGCGFFGEKLDWGDASGMTLMLGAAGLALRPAPRRVAAAVVSVSAARVG